MNAISIENCTVSKVPIAPPPRRVRDMQDGELASVPVYVDKTTGALFTSLEEILPEHVLPDDDVLIGYPLLTKVAGKYYAKITSKQLCYAASRPWEKRDSSVDVLAEIVD